VTEPDPTLDPDSIDTDNGEDTATGADTTPES